MLTADPEFHHLRSWVLCLTITLIVLGTFSLFVSLAAQDGITIGLGTVAALFMIGTGATGLQARYHNDLAKANCCKIGVVILLTANCLVLMLWIFLAIVDYQSGLYMIGPILTYTAVVVFLACSTKVINRFVHKLKESRATESGLFYPADYVPPTLDYPLNRSQ